MKIISINPHNTDHQAKGYLEKIAWWHNLTPKLWRPDYRITRKDMESTLTRLKDIPGDRLFLEAAIDDQGELLGFLWAVKEKDEQAVMILSLYIEEEYREKGYAKRLKASLEEWCHQEQIRVIKTTTHYKNKKMIALNEGLGYQPGMVELVKKL